MSIIDLILAVLVVAIIFCYAVKFLDNCATHVGNQSRRRRESEEQTRQLVEAWDAQARKYDFYFNKEESKGVLLPDRTRHYDGTPRF